jgi:hypothetical protein
MSQSARRETRPQLRAAPRHRDAAAPHRGVAALGAGGDGEVPDHAPTVPLWACPLSPMARYCPPLWDVVTPNLARPVIPKATSKYGVAGKSRSLGLAARTGARTHDSDSKLVSVAPPRAASRADRAGRGRWAAAGARRSKTGAGVGQRSAPVAGSPRPGLGSRLRVTPPRRIQRIL